MLTASACERQNADPHILRAGAITVPGTPWYENWELLAQRLAHIDSPLVPRWYVVGQLGSEESSLAQLRRGRIQMGGYSLQGASSVVPELSLLLAPYLFDSLAEIDFVLDHYLTEAFAHLFEAKGLTFLGWSEVGWTYLYGVEPLLSPADTAGRKLRSSNALASQLFVRAIGANMVPLPFPDIIPSLQTGLIDGGESGSLIYALANVPAEAPHLTLTRHAFDTGLYLANSEWLERLAPEVRKGLLQSLPSTPDQRARVRAAEAALMANPSAYGIVLHQPNDAQLDAWRAASAANHQRLIDAIGGDAQRIYARILQGKQAYAQHIKEINAPAAGTAPRSPAPTASTE